MVISFNSRYLIDIASQIENDSIIIKLKDPSSPVLIKDLSDNSTDSLVEEYIYHNVLFRDPVSLINSYYKLLSGKDDKLSLIDKLDLDIN